MTIQPAGFTGVPSERSLPGTSPLEHLEQDLASPDVLHSERQMRDLEEVEGIIKA